MKYLICIITILSAFGSLSSYNTDHIIVDILMGKNMPHVAGSEIRKIEKNLLRQPEYIMVKSHNLETVYIEFLNGNYAEVRTILDEMEFNETDPDIIKEIVLLQGKNSFMLGNIKKAEKYLKDYTIRYSESSNIWEAFYYLAEIYYSESQYSKAYEMSTKALDSNQSSAVLTLHIKNLIAYNMDEQAASYINTLYEKDPAYGDYSRILINNFYLKKGMYNKVSDSEDMDSNSQFYPDFIGQKITAGILSGDLNSSESLLNESTLDPELKDYFKLLILLKSMNYKDAEKHINENMSSISNKEIRRKTEIISISLFSSNEMKLNKYDEIIESNDPLMKPMAIFYKGLAYLKNNDFENCITEMMKVENSKYYYDAQYIIAESFYFMNNLKEAEVFYNKYTAESVDGFYTDQAYFKTGLIHLLNDNEDAAHNVFKKIVDNYKHSEFYADACYYLGEIYYLRKDLGTSVNYLHESYIAGNRNDNLLNRLSEVQQKLGNNDASMEALGQIKDIDKYKFNRIFTEANILYSGKSYQKALERYKDALRVASGQKEKNKAETQIGWCYYNMDNFSEASKYLKKNSVDEEGKEFLEVGAEAAYDNQDYASAIDFYTDYMKTQKGGRLYKIQNRLAESYYNMGNYAKASEFFVKAALKAGSLEDFEESLAGVVKSNEAREINYVPVLESISANIANSNMKELVSEYIIISKQRSGNWNEVISLCKNHLKTSDNPDIVLILGKAYAELDLNHKAYELYENSKEINAGIYAHWGKLLIEDRFYKKGEARLDSASVYAEDQEVLLNILKLQNENRFSGFSDTYDKLKSSEDKTYKALADIEMIDFLLAQKSYSSVEPLLNANRLNEDDNIKAEIQLRTYKLLYYQNDYEKAIVELLKISYMFSDNKNVSTEGKYYLIKCYIATGEKAKADNMYSMIRDSLSDERIKELDKILIK